MTATPQFLPLELISIGIQSHIPLPPDLSLWMSQDTSHSPCPISPLEPLSPTQTDPSASFLFQSLAPPSQMLFTKHSQAHPLPFISRASWSTSTHPVYLGSCHTFPAGNSISILSLNICPEKIHTKMSLKKSLCSLRIKMETPKCHLQSPASSDPFLTLQPPHLPPSSP